MKKINIKYIMEEQQRGETKAMINEYVKVFRAFSDAKRVRILELLCNSEECACVLLDDLDISQPTLSHHMKILCDSGIVTGRRQGRWMYYRINEDGCEYASRLLQNLKEHKLDSIVKFIAGIHRKAGNRAFADKKKGESCCCGKCDCNQKL